RAPAGRGATLARHEPPGSDALDGGYPAARTGALGAVSGALIGAAMGAGAGLAVGTATAGRGRLDGLDVCQHASGTGDSRAVTAARHGPDSRGAGLDVPMLMIHK